MNINSKNTLIFKTIGVLATITLFLLIPFATESFFSSSGQNQKVLVLDTATSTLDQIRSYQKTGGLICLARQLQMQILVKK